MTPDDFNALRDLWRDTMDWLPPAGAADDRDADWREISCETFRVFREARDRELVRRFQEILAAERRRLEHDMAMTAPDEPLLEPDTRLH